MEQENWESVKDEVLTIVSRRYLEPSLKRIEVVRDVSSMNHTLAGTFITQVGFYRLVNAFRIRHYERLSAPNQRERKNILSKRSHYLSFRDSGIGHEGTTERPVSDID
jgi:hypothetical protein